MAFLRCLSGQFQRRTYEVAEPSCILGRKEDCHIWELFENRTNVSRHHARIDQLGNRYLLTDLGSRNGTLLNGDRITQPMPLTNGDTIAICGIEFRFGQRNSNEVFSAPPVEVISDFESSTDNAISSREDARVSPLRTTDVIPAATARLSAILGMLTALGATLELREILQSLVNEILEIFPAADASVIGIRQQVDGPVMPAAVSQRHPDMGAVYLSQAIMQRVLAEKEALLFQDAPGDQRLTESASIACQGIRSVMCAPLLDGKHQVLGVVHVDKRAAGGPFGEKDLQMLVALGPLLSVALRFAQLYQQALKQQAFEQELAAAHRVQQGLLPQRPPTVPGYEFFSFYSAAREVGGDYYDYIALPDGRLALAVADAAGKGAGAALQVASVSGGLKALLTSSRSLSQAVSHLNRQLCLGRTESQFVTMALLVLDPLRHEVEVLSAGHERPLWRRPTGELSEVGDECGGLPLGVREDATYQTMRLDLGAGDMLLMYTDGVRDAQNSRQEFFDVRRIRALFGGEGEGIGDLGRRVVQEVFDFMGREAQFDDISLVGLGRLATDQESSKPATTNCELDGVVNSLSSSAPRS